MLNLSAKALLAFSPGPPSLIGPEASLRDVVRKLLENPATREVYVVDAEQRFVGLVALRRIAQHVFLHQNPNVSSATEMLDLISAENAGQLCLRKPVYVREEDNLERVLHVMFNFDINEIVVVDEDHRVVGSLKMMDLVRAWRDGKLDELAG